MKFAAALCAGIVLCALPASAHVAFSSVELHVTGRAVDVTVVAQAYDLAHDLGIDPPERLVDLDFLVQQREALGRLMNAALSVDADGAALTAEPWGTPAAAPEQQLVRLRTRYTAERAPGRVTITSRLFSYDTAHQTLLTVYTGDALETQQMLDAARPSYDYFTHTPEGWRSVMRQFSRAGAVAAVTGYAHLLFLVALLLHGGTPRRLAAILAAFTASYSVAFALAASARIAVPVAVIAPGIALSVVYAGIDNLLVRGGRDTRVWIALAFGWLHGFGFATAVVTMDRPVHGLGWALGAFNAGAEVAFLAASLGLAALTGLAAQAGRDGQRRLVTVASILVAIVGAASFIRQIAVR